VLEHASVQGRSFEAGALAELLAESGPGAISTQLVSLVQKQLIRPDRSAAPGEDVFRFAHALIREAAYHGLPKQRRAELHEALARRPDPGSDELIGYHLAEAHRNLTELGVRETSLGTEAAGRLAAAARTALMRGDPPAAARLLERAESLLPDGEEARAELLPALGAALFAAGRIADATHVLDEAIAGGSSAQLRARAQVEREIVRVDAEPDAGTDRALEVADGVLPVFEGAGDDLGICRAEFLRGEVAWNAGHAAEAEAAWRTAAGAASRAGDQREVFELVGWRALAAALGPTPVEEAIDACQEFRERVRSSPLATASTLNPLALLHAMKGEFDSTERLLDEASGMLEEIRGLGAGVSHLEALARFLTGRPELVEDRLRADVETLSAMSEVGAQATTTALLAQCVYARGRFEEAGELAMAAERRASAEDRLTQAILRGVRAKVLARSGSCDEACAVAREAVVLLEHTDLLSQRGDAMLALAEVLRTCERRDEADRVTKDALEQYELKGNTVTAERARSLLSD
jgi:tetratricopeptide (TPR) repeat protein